MIESLVVRQCIEQCAPEDRALLANLTMWAEDNDDVMLSVLAAPAFIELKLQLPNGLSSLVAELNDIAERAPQEPSIRLVANALALSADVLARDPGQLATQVIARMRGAVGGLTDLLVANLAREYEGAMMPLTTGLVGAEQAFLSQRVSDSEVKAMAASPTSRWAAVLDASGGVALVEALPHQLHVRATILCPGASALVFVPDGGHIVATSNNGDLWVIELASRTCVTRARIEADTVVVGCLDRHCVVLEGERGLSVIRLDEDGRSETLAAVKVPRTLISARALDFKRRQIVTGTLNGRVDAWDSTSGALERRVGWFGPFEADFGDQSTAALVYGLLQGRFWVSSKDGAKQVNPQDLLARIARDKANARAVNDLCDDPLRHSVRSLAVDWDSRYIAAVARGSLRLWDTSSGRRLANIDGLAGGDPILAFDSQRRVLCAASRDEVLLWSLPLLESTRRIRLPRSDLTTVCCPKESGLMLAAFTEGTVVGLSPDLTADAALRADAVASIREIGWCNDEGDFWLARSSGHIEQWRLDTLRCEQQLPTIFGDLSCVHLSDDGRRMVASAGDAVVVTDVTTGLPLFHVPVALNASLAQLARACVSRSGTRVVVEPKSDPLGALLGAQGQVALIEMDSGRTTVLEQAAGQVHDLLVSYDGRYAVAVLMTLQQHGETSGSRVRINLWNLEACETVLQLDFLHHVSCAFSAARRSILWYHDGNLYELGVDRLDANPLVRHVGEPWQSFAVDDAGFLIARCEYRRIQILRVEDLSMVGAFDTDRAIRSVRVVADQHLVLACDEDGAFYAFRCPAIGARSHELKKSANSLSLSGVEGSTQALYEIGRTFGRAELRESAMALLQLARARDATSTFMLGVANLLYEVSEGEQADALVQSAFSKADASAQERAVDLLKKRGGDRGLQIVLSSTSTVYLLQDACREAISRKDAQTLEVFSRRGRPALTRLIAAQALAILEPGLSAQALSEILADKEVEGAVQVTAWISMGAVIGRREWLKSLHYPGRVDSWDVNLRVAAAWEVVGALRTPLIISAARPANEAAPLPIEPIRRALAWDQIAVFYNMLGQTDAALGACSRAIEMRPNAARYRYTRGMVYLTQARQVSPARSSSDLAPQRQDLIRLAISDLSAAIALDPDYDAAWSQRGYAYLEIEESELGIHDIKKALELGMSDYAEYRNLAAALSQLGRTREAEEAERRADRLRSNEELGFDHQPPVRPARMRAGDDMDEPEGEDQESRTSAALDALAVLGVTDLIRKRLRELAFSKDFSDQFRAVFADSYVALAPQQHPVKSQPGGKTFWSRLQQAWREHKDSDSPSDLMQIVIDLLLPSESRSQAAHSLLQKGGTQAAVEILHKLEDTEPSHDDIPEGVRVALATMKALAGLRGGIDALRVLTRDTTAPAMVREIAAELIGSRVSPIEGITALNALAATLPNGHPVQRYILKAIDHYESQLRESSRNQAGSPDDRAIDAFFKANSMAELEELAKKDGVFFDRRFVQMLERLADNVPADQRSRYMRNLEWIRALPVSAEILAWRAFEDAISLESMRDASRRHPLLGSRHFRAEVEKIIAEIRNNLEVASALRRRLEWLRQIPESDALGSNGSFRATPVTSVGRNDPCPCGSGKKYKVCHGRLA